MDALSDFDGAMTPQVLSTVGEHAAAGRCLGGSLLWMAAANSYPDYDGTTIYLAPAQPPAPADAAVIEALRRHAADMAGLPSAQDLACTDNQQQSCRRSVMPIGRGACKGLRVASNEGQRLVVQPSGHY